MSAAIERYVLDTSALGDLKSAYRLSFADAWIAALALRQKAVLVHKDPEFEPLSQSLALQTLPYK